MAISEESPAVQAHLTILQEVVQRMAGNSAAAKGWCIAIVSAILVVVADKGQPRLVIIAAIPTMLFLALDAYYLSLEKRFRESYNIFIRKLHEGKIEGDDLYVVAPARGDHAGWLMRSLISFSVWPFYFTLLAMIYLSGLVIDTPPAPAQ